MINCGYGWRRGGRKGEGGRGVVVMDWVLIERLSGGEL